jgi:pilus assembly protein CpaB
MDRRFLAVMGISLLFALVVSALFYNVTSRAGGRQQAEKRIPLTTMVTAATALPVGLELKPSDLKAISVPRDRVPPGAFEKVEQVVGRAVISNILADEPVLAGRLSERGSGFGLSPVIPPGMRAVGVKVNEVVGVAGFVVPGMRVDVLVTVRAQGDLGARTNTVLQNIVVAAAGQQIQPDSSGRAVNVPVVTLLVTPEQAETLTLASSEGRIQLVLRNAGDQTVAKTPGRAVEELYGVKPVARPAAVRQVAVPVAVAQAAAAPAAPPGVEVLVIRGSQASVEAVAGARSN